MKKHHFFAVLTVLSVGLAGCSSPPPPPPPPPVPQTPAEKMQAEAGEIRASGGLAVVGTGESESAYLAEKKAVVDGRRKLAALLKQKIEVLEEALPEDTAALSAIAGQLTSPETTGSAEQRFEHETDGGRTMTRVLMVLDPALIRRQLAKDEALYERLLPTPAFEALNQQIKTYEAFRAAQP